ncbi:anti-sigma factor [Herbiconiux sp. CPCC 203407]|uniref:Anti-sigma factor n=1 Tax=Herbiconiux oxytropis TaxID=2970915 RepID=A0AA41XJT6_9MICO|nr:anti-sigma factor [Herbiconiux oxytropis]MCS5723547.1 anti-sigma factor [Herbiconiux oxytropis]MCS5727473.1 anti-sigma factor [Herbiconiux oxytropis]
MEHTDPDALALIALGDTTATDRERAHLASCAVCSDELDALTRTVQHARAADAEPLVDPAAAVWARIHDELQLSIDLPASGSAPAATSPAETSPAATSPAGTSPAATSPAATRAAAPAASSHLATRKPASRRRARLWAPLAGAALVLGLVAGAGVGVWWQGSQQSPRGIAVAGAELAPFPDWPDARGSAVVEQSGDGRRQVVVDVDAAVDPAVDPAAGGGEAPLREVWLIRGDGTGLVSIGFLDGREGRFDVPSGIDLAQYSLVDISAETDDGDPTHSGDSILRGELSEL